MSILVVLVALSWGRFCLRNGQVTAQMAVSPAPAGPLSFAGLRPRSRRFHRYLVYRWQRPGPLRTATRHAVQVAKLRLRRVLIAKLYIPRGGRAATMRIRGRANTAHTSSPKRGCPTRYCVAVQARARGARAEPAARRPLVVTEIRRKPEFPQRVGRDAHTHLVTTRQLPDHGFTL